MKKIAATEFRKQCLTLLDRIDPDGILITKRGRPVAHLMPVLNNCSSLIGSLRGKLTLTGNLLTTGEPWDAES